jgi:CheY-like chemotaxis protein
MPRVVAFVEDLLFASRIREAARRVGVEVQGVRRPEDVAVALGAGAPLVLVDADSDRLPWRQAIAAARSDPAFSSVPVVAFFSHVNGERAEAARSAGASRVLTRSTFVQELPRLLAAAALPSEEKTS